MAGNILAMQLGQADPDAVLPWDGVQWEDGLRAMLAVTRVVAKVQTTIFYGNSLYMIWNSIGQMSPQEGFSFFLKQYYNRPVTYVQLLQLPYANVPAQFRHMVPTPQPPPPETTGTLTLLKSGYDPLRGYYMEFAGNYNLGFPLFRDWPDVLQDVPDYRPRP